MLGFKRRVHGLVEGGSRVLVKMTKAFVSCLILILKMFDLEE